MVNKVQSVIFYLPLIGQCDWFVYFLFVIRKISSLSLSLSRLILVFLSVYGCSDRNLVYFNIFAEGKQQFRRLSIALSLCSSFRIIKSEMEIDPNAAFGSNLSTNSRLEPSRCVDLIVLGINYRSNEEDVRNYFQQFGELVFCEVRDVC